MGDEIHNLLAYLENNGFPLTEGNLEETIRFLERQYGRHKEEYELDFKTPPNKNKYMSLMLDKLILFSYLARLDLMTDFSGEPTFINSNEKLDLLKIKDRIYQWSEPDLAQLYQRRVYGNREYSLMSYVDIINEIGEDETIVRIWGRKLVYEVDFSPLSKGVKRSAETRTSESYKKRPRGPLEPENVPLEDSKEHDYVPLYPHLDCAAGSIYDGIEEVIKPFSEEEIKSRLLKRMTELPHQMFDPDIAQDLIKINGTTSSYDKSRKGFMISVLLKAANEEFKEYGIRLIVEDGRYIVN